jgi:hypothetical protein
LQATNAPDINGKFIWVAPTNPRPLWFAIQWAVTDTLEAASAFSIEADGRLVSRHLNGTQYANIDYFGNFELIYMMERDEIRRRAYNYLRCSMRPPSGKYAGNYKELYCLADGSWHREAWNYCPLYKEYFNAPFVMGDKWSQTAPACYAVVLLVRPICGWT